MICAINISQLPGGTFVVPCPAMRLKMTRNNEELTNGAKAPMNGRGLGSDALRVA